MPRGGQLTGTTLEAFARRVLRDSLRQVDLELGCHNVSCIWPW